MYSNMGKLSLCCFVTCPCSTCICVCGVGAWGEGWVGVCVEGVFGLELFVTKHPWYLIYFYSCTQHYLFSSKYIVKLILPTFNRGANRPLYIRLFLAFAVLPLSLWMCLFHHSFFCFRKTDRICHVLVQRLSWLLSDYRIFLDAERW